MVSNGVNKKVLENINVLKIALSLSIEAISTEDGLKILFFFKSITILDWEWKQ